MPMEIQTELLKYIHKCTRFIHQMNIYTIGMISSRQFLFALCIVHHAHMVSNIPDNNGNGMQAMTENDVFQGCVNFNQFLALCLFRIFSQNFNLHNLKNKKSRC